MKDLVPDCYDITFRLYPYAKSPDQMAEGPVRQRVSWSGTSWPIEEG